MTAVWDGCLWAWPGSCWPWIFDILSFFMIGPCCSGEMEYDLWTSLVLFSYLSSSRLILDVVNGSDFGADVLQVRYWGIDRSWGSRSSRHRRLLLQRSLLGHRGFGDDPAPVGGAGLTISGGSWSARSRGGRGARSSCRENVKVSFRQMFQLWAKDQSLWFCFLWPDVLGFLGSPVLISALSFLLAVQKKQQAKHHCHWNIENTD